MKFYLVRHGESEGNVKKTFCGHTDAKLTAKGYEQAKRMAQYFTDIQVDKLYSSPLQRAYNTALEISKIKHIDIIQNDMLIERDFGVFEGLTWEMIEVLYPKQANEFIETNINYEIPNGESFQDLSIRADRVLNSISDNSVLVTHGAFINSLLLQMKVIDIDKLWDLPIHNCSIVCIEDNQLLDIIAN